MDKFLNFTGMNTILCVRLNWKSVPVVTFRSTQRDLTLEVFFNAIRLSGILYQGKARYIRPDN